VKKKSRREFDGLNRGSQEWFFYASTIKTRIDNPKPPPRES